jgi:hypothetical protein
MKQAWTNWSSNSWLLWLLSMLKECVIGRSHPAHDIDWAAQRLSLMHINDTKQTLCEISAKVDIFVATMLQ